MQQLIIEKIEKNYFVFKLNSIHNFIFYFNFNYTYYVQIIIYINVTLFI